MTCLDNTTVVDAPASTTTSPLFDVAHDFNDKVADMPDWNEVPIMSAEDPSFIGWENHRMAQADNIFTSPLWTDPSPALTDHNSFDSASCGPSPLLTDDLDGPSSDVANMPLFGDMTLFSPHVRTEGNFGSATPSSAPAAAQLPADFSLFPELATSSPPRGQMAFNPAATQPAEDPAVMLLRALQSAAAQRQQQQQGPVTTASPTLISSPPKDVTGAAQDLTQPRDAEVARKPPMLHSATEPLLTISRPDEEKLQQQQQQHHHHHHHQQQQQCQHESTATACTDAVTRCRRGTKRRMGVDDLLPLDAPIQSRNYLGPSATSRKDFFDESAAATAAAAAAASSDADRDRDNGPTSEDLAAIAAETDPLKAKRLSNTLAARRSRHRKAQERAELEGTIAELRAELATYKKRLERTEAERDELGDRLKRCRCGP